MLSAYTASTRHQVPSFQTIRPATMGPKVGLISKLFYVGLLEMFIVGINSLTYVAFEPL